MAKNSIADYSATAASNTDIQSVDIDEGCAPSGINNAIRELMADIAGELSPTADAQFAGVNYPAIAGIVESNANFIDACLVGPSVDGKAWAGAFSNGSVWASLMLATVETSGANAEVNIWDLTAGTLASASPLATVTLTGATPTSIAASMGYVIVGTSDQGFHIVDPHGGSWAERTAGWPRSINVTTPAPAVNNLNISHVTAGHSPGSGFDPRTGGQIPNFGIGYAAGGAAAGLVKWDGNVYDESAYTSTAAGSPVVIVNGMIFLWRDDIERVEGSRIDLITGAWSPNGAHYETNLFPSVTTVHDYDATPDGILVGFAEGLYRSFGLIAGINPGSQRAVSMQWFANRTYNTGLVPNNQKLVALANSKTADRSGNSNTLTENGTVTEAAVETGSELLGYSGFTAANNLTRGDDADYNSFGTGAVHFSGWVKSSGNSAVETLAGIANAGNTVRFTTRLNTNGTLGVTIAGASTSGGVNSTSVVDDGAWHRWDVLRRSDTELEFWVDGVLEATDATAYGSISGTILFAIGVRPDDGSTEPATTSTISLVHLAGSAPSAEQINEMYVVEKDMFVASAKCLLQGASDAVLDARIDPLTGKYIVTQSDTQDIFDGLAIETERTIAAGGTTFEHGLLWNDGVAEINDANLYASMPATDQRQVNEMVRSMAAELPAGVDLSKAKAFLVLEAATTIRTSFNIVSVANPSTGVYDVLFAVPFKTKNFSVVATSGVPDGTGSTAGIPYLHEYLGTSERIGVRVNFDNDAGAKANRNFCLVAFGELENE